MADEKYRLTLEGSEIDEALLRLANYEDEGLVLGSRKGVMLGPGSEYYHKNARYYAELAQSAVPGDTTSAVRWDIDQSALTDADREMARKNIRAGGSNRNILDNGWFTVRQKGNGPFVAQISADRWYAAGGGLQVTLGDGGATLVFSSTYREFRQTIANPTYYANGTYTMSIKVTGYTSSGSIRMQVHDGANASVALFTFNGDGIHTFTFTTGANGIGRLGLYNIANADATMTVEAIKLERGSVSTLANDTPPDYGTELLKCQRHFVRVGLASSNYPMAFGYAYSATNVRYLIPLPVTLRATPTLSFTGSFQALDTTGSTRQITAFTPVATVTHGLLVLCTTSNHAIGMSTLMTNANTFLDISCDLQ